MTRIATLMATAIAVAMVPSAGAKVAPTGSLTTPRAAHSATLLPSGNVLVAGGCTLPGCDDAEGQTASAELYDAASGRFSPTGSLHRPRIGQLAVRLPDGRALLAGGWSLTKATSAVEVYDEASGTFREAPPLPSPRADGTATLLRDGRILFAGGTDGRNVLATAVLYDPRTGRSTRTGSLSGPRYIHTATRLRDGRVLVVGGATTNVRVLRGAELYDPRTGRFTRVGPLARPRYKHAAALLPNGRVLVVGGAPRFDLGARYCATELFDPGRRRFVPDPRLSFSRYHLADAVLALPSGRVLIAGDAPQVEIYDARTGRVARGGAVGVNLSFGTATRLRDGRVLLAGGYDSATENPTDRAWIFRAG